MNRFEYVRAYPPKPLVYSQTQPNLINNAEDCWSEHGLGQLLNPTDLESEDRQWIGSVWLNMIRKASGLPAKKLKFENQPAVAFNFLLTCHVSPLGHPIGTKPERFHLITPYESDPRKWLKMDWIEQYSGATYRVQTSSIYSTRKTARVKTYGEVIAEYEFHPESKCADATGNASNKQTVGLLQRRHVQIDRVHFIGKESNHFEEVAENPKRDTNELLTHKPKDRKALEKLKDTSVLRREYLSGNDKLIHLMVLNYFTAVDRLFWTPALETSFITRTVGVQALFDVLKFVAPKALKDRVISVEFFSEILRPAADINFADEKYRDSSGAGRSKIRHAIENAVIM